MCRASVRLARGDRSGALADWDRTLELAREVKDPQRMLPALLQNALGYALLGRDDEARALALEAADLARGHPELGEYMGQIAGPARRLGLREELRPIAAQGHQSPWQKAAVAALSGDFVKAADIFADGGAIAIEAGERFWAAHELLEAGRRAEAEEQLEKALAFYRTVGATFFIEQGEALLADAQSASA